MIIAAVIFFYFFGASIMYGIGVLKLGNTEGFYEIKNYDLISPSQQLAFMSVSWPAFILVFLSYQIAIHVGKFGVWFARKLFSSSQKIPKATASFIKKERS